MNPPTTIILYMSNGELLTFSSPEVTMVDQYDKKGAFARSILAKGVQQIKVKVDEEKRDTYRRKIERRAGQAGVNARHTDKDEDIKDLKRIRRGRKV